MMRRWRGVATSVLIVVFAFLHGASDSRSQDYGAETLETFFFLDLKSFKVKIYELPSGKTLVEETENIESTLGASGLAIAKKFPKTWVVLGPTTRTATQPEPTPYLKECMKIFDLSYLGSVAVKAPESELTEPEEPAPQPQPQPAPPQQGPSPQQPKPKFSGKGVKNLDETWGDATDDPDEDNGPPSIEDDPGEPGNENEPEVDAFLHIWRFNGKRAQ